jgi:flagellar FliJ protein
MKRFVWRLQRVLDIKKKQEEKKRAELLVLTEKLAAARGDLLMEQKILANLIHSIVSQSPGKRLAEQEFFLTHSAVSNEQIKRLKDKIRELELQQKEKMAEVIKIRRFKEGLERLQAEAKAKFTAEQEKLEQKQLDEIAGIAFVRKALSQEMACE